MTPRLSASHGRWQHRLLPPLTYRLPDISDTPTSSRKRPANWYLRLALVMGIALLGFSTRSAWAAEPDVADADEDRSPWGLGLAVGAMQKPYRDIDSDTIVRPIIIYDNDWIGIRGGTISLKLPSAGPVSFAVTADYSNDGYEASDSSFLRGMDEREDGFWAGATATWENSIVNLSVNWSTDASGNSEGQKLAISAERAFERGRFEFTPRVGAVWLDDHYVDYYYGVRAHEVTADRGAYAPDATVNVEVGLRTTFRMSERNSVFLDLSAQSLGSEIEDSPIVDASTESRIFMGYVHMF